MFMTANGTQLRMSGPANSWISNSHPAGASVAGTAGNDVFYAQAADRMAGGAGDDQYNVWSTSFTINEAAGGGVDTLYANVWGPVLLPDNVENLILAGEGATQGTGNALNNIVAAGTSGGWLDGGAGDDVLVGGAGRDIFQLKAGNGSDAIENFSHGSDLVRLEGYGIASFADLMSHATQVGADTVIALPGGGTTALRGVQMSSLSGADFSFSDNGIKAQASTAFDTPAAGSGLTQQVGPAQCSFGAGWSVLNNVWGSGGLTYGRDYKVASTFHAGDITGGTTFSWDYPLLSTTATSLPTILAYPAVIFGGSPYGTGYNPAGDSANVFPVQLSALNGLKANYDVGFGGDTRGYNVSYDIFLTSQPHGLALTITNEVMIWLHQGDFEVYGDRVGTYQDGDFSATIYHQAGTPYTAVVFNGDAPAGDLDIAKIFARLEELGILSKSEYLADVELGAEVVSGSGSLTINNLDLTVQTANADRTTTTKLVTGTGTTVSTSAPVVTPPVVTPPVEVTPTPPVVVPPVEVTPKPPVVTPPVVTPPAPPVDAAIHGTSADDNLVGNAGSNLIYGGSGNDMLDGGAGNDTMFGGVGDDTYRVDRGGDVVLEKGGEGDDTIITTVSYALIAGQEIETLKLDSSTGNAPLQLTGNELANTIVGNAGSNLIYGGGGNDILDGGGGNDTMFGGVGDDTYRVDRGGDVVLEKGGEGDDTIITTVSYALIAGQEIETLKLDSSTGNAPLQLTGNELANTIVGNAGSNLIYGGGGNDILDGGGGNDTLFGGVGDDTYYVDRGGDVVIEKGGEGDDTIITTANYSLIAGQEIETLKLAASTGTAPLQLVGNELANTLIGNAGNNALYGGGGNDVLDGGAGVDELHGGLGADTFLFRDGDSGKTSATADRIIDFSHVQGDKIDLSNIDANLLLDGDQAFTFHSSGADHVAGAMWLTSLNKLTDINLDTDGDGKADYLIHVINPTNTPLAASDFVY